MIKYLFIFLMFIFSINNASGNNDLPKANERIKAFVQVWGLVKYRSLTSIEGKFNADSVFLVLIDKVKNANQNQFTELIATLLKENPGNPELNKTQVNQEKTLTKNIDYSWIKNKIFTSAIQKQLSALTLTYNPHDEHYFIPKIAHESELPNENEYKNYAFDHEPMNLLALAKAWNAIAYLFPYRYVMDQKWEVTLQKLIPTFSAIKSRATYEKSVLLLESAIDDTHAKGFLNQVKSLPEILDLKYYPPFVYKIYQNQVLITAFLNDSLSQSSTLKVGDLITQINGIQTKEWLKQRATLLPASNLSVKNKLLADNDALAFSALSNGELKLKIRRNKRYLNLSLSLLERKNKQTAVIVTNYFKQKSEQNQLIKGYEELPNDVAILRAGYFFDKDLPSDNELTAFSENLNKKKAIIFDMRAYPASPGLFYYYIPMALGKAAFKFAQYYGANISNPGTFIKKEGIEVFLSKDIAPVMPLYKGKIVILTNENTQSMGEWFSMMLRQITSNTVIIGSQTAGADGDLKRLNLPGGYKFVFTGNGIFYRNGKETQRIGILPDLWYQPSAQEVVTKTDGQLEKALTYLREERSANHRKSEQLSSTHPSFILRSSFVHPSVILRLIDAGIRSLR